MTYFLKPESLVTYAIGDVHGCLEKLVPLLECCAAHCGDRLFRLVFLGDYVDRGPDSYRVVDRLLDLQSELPDKVICLRGNHEALMLQAVRTRDDEIWLMNGGEATLGSYDVQRACDISDRHLEWIDSLPLSYDDGRRFFVHAGVDSNLPLTDQSEEVLLWMREPFLSRQYDYGRLIVHGHTPVPSRTPDLRPWRLNLDTGAVYGGPLTAAAFTQERTAPVAFLTHEGAVIGV
jgi:serine/threonine protein phosphatase 1